jgi:hypothetical protein
MISIVLTFAVQLCMDSGHVPIDLWLGKIIWRFTPNNIGVLLITPAHSLDATLSATSHTAS